jgi:hypothetical protein
MMEMAERDKLVAEIINALRVAIAGSKVVLGGGEADVYSDIVLEWEVPAEKFEQVVPEVRAILGGVRAVESLQMDAGAEQSNPRRPFSVRFKDVPLFWRLDLELIAQGNESGAGKSGFRTGENGWSRSQSALEDAIAAVKAHLRGNVKLAEELMVRGFERVGLPETDISFRERVLGLVDWVEMMDRGQASLCERVRVVVEERVKEEPDDRDMWWLKG